MSRAARRLAVPIATAAAILAATILAVTGHSSWTTADLEADNLEDIGDARRIQTEELTAATRALGAHVDDLVASVERSNASTATLTQQRDQARTTGEQLTASLNDVDRRLSEAKTLNASQYATFTGMQRCLEGIQRSSFATLFGDSAKAVTELQSVETTCADASRALGIAGPSSFPFDFSDPFVVTTEGTYYGFATNAGGGTIQMISSTDLQSWRLLGNALPALPSWAKPGNTWAPSVIKLADSWVMYYTVRESLSEMQCISSAVAKEPSGPYVDDSTGPMICQRDLVGSIDPSPILTTEGGLFLVWKADGVNNRSKARLWSAPLDATGRKPLWFPIELTRQSRSWEGSVVEGPTMVQRGDKFIVLYSGNDWNSANYATGYLVCDTAVGPCTKPDDNLVANTIGTRRGTGGAEVFNLDGQPWVVYHAWEGSDIGYPNKRQMHTSPLTFNKEGRPGFG